SVVRAKAASESDATAITVPTAVLAAFERFATQRRPGQPAILSPAALRRIDVERGRETGGFDEYDGLIADEGLRDLLDERYEQHTFSASELNEFGDCAFRFFLKRVLGLAPRVEAALDLQALETGVLLHDVLRRFFEGYRERSIADVAVAELRAALARAC